MFKNFLLSTILFLGIFCFTSSFKVSASDKVTIEFSDLANILPWAESSCALNEGGIKLYSCKENISSSERYLDILVKLDTTITDIKGTKVVASLYSNKDLNKALVKREVPATAPNSVVCIDMRQLNEHKACLKVEWKDVRNRLLGTGIVWISSDPITPLSADTKIPFTIDVPNGVDTLTNYPVRFGVPFPEGSVWNTDNLILVDSKGKELPSQFEVAGRWAREGAIKWLLIDSIISGKNGDEIYLVLGKRSSKSLPSTPVVVRKKGDTFDVNTGVAQYIVGVDGALIKEARLNKQLTAKEGKSRGLYVVDQIGRLAKAGSKDASVKLEADGPVSAVIRVEGFYVTDDGEELARHITRLEFNSGRPEVSATHTLVLTQDTNKVLFIEVVWEFETVDTKNVKGLFSVASENPQDISTIPIAKNQKINIIQTEGINLGIKPTSYYRWNKPKTDSYWGTPWVCSLHGKNSFEVRQTSKETITYKDKSMGDWAALTGNNLGFMVSCRNIGAQHPKEYQ